MIVDLMESSIPSETKVGTYKLQKNIIMKKKRWDFIAQEKKENKESPKNLTKSSVSQATGQKASFDRQKLEEATRSLEKDILNQVFNKCDLRNILERYKAEYLKNKAEPASGAKTLRTTCNFGAQSGTLESIREVLSNKKKDPDSANQVVRRYYNFLSNQVNLSLQIIKDYHSDPENGGFDEILEQISTVSIRMSSLQALEEITLIDRLKNVHIKKKDEECKRSDLSGFVRMSKEGAINFMQLQELRAEYAQYNDIIKLFAVKDCVPIIKKVNSELNEAIKKLRIQLEKSDHFVSTVNNQMDHYLTKSRERTASEDWYKNLDKMRILSNISYGMGTDTRKSEEFITTALTQQKQEYLVHALSNTSPFEKVLEKYYNYLRSLGLQESNNKNDAGISNFNDRINIDKKPNHDSQSELSDHQNSVVEEILPGIQLLPENVDSAPAKDLPKNDSIPVKPATTLCFDIQQFCSKFFSDCCGTRDRDPVISGFSNKGIPLSEAESIYGQEMKLISTINVGQYVIIDPITVGVQNPEGSNCFELVYEMYQKNSEQGFIIRSETATKHIQHASYAIDTTLSSQLLIQKSLENELSLRSITNSESRSDKDLEISIEQNVHSNMLVIKGEGSEVRGMNSITTDIRSTSAENILGIERSIYNKALRQIEGDYNNISGYLSSVASSTSRIMNSIKLGYQSKQAFDRWYNDPKDNHKTIEVGMSFTKLKTSIMSVTNGASGYITQSGLEAFKSLLHTGASWYNDETEQAKDYGMNTIKVIGETIAMNYAFKAAMYTIGSTPVSIGVAAFSAYDTYQSLCNTDSEISWINDTTGSEFHYDDLV